MISKTLSLFTKIYLSLTIIFFSSCKENYSFINNPPHGIEYESKVFDINHNNSNSYRSPDYNSGNSQLLYLGKVDEHNSNETTSDILLRIDKELILQSDVCLSDDVSEYNLNSLEMILRMKTNIEFDNISQGISNNFSNDIIDNSSSNQYNELNNSASDSDQLNPIKAFIKTFSVRPGGVKFFRNLRIVVFLQRGTPD